MTARRAFTAASLVLIWTAVTHVSTSATAAQNELPADEGRNTVITICGDCHGPEYVANQRRSRVEWEMLVEDMANRNGVATEDDRKVIVGYALRNFGKVNINTAPADDITLIVQLPAGQSTAIVDYRQKSGEFKTLEDLRKVPGIDFAKIQERKDRIGFSGP
jgi:competence protein ComEA